MKIWIFLTLLTFTSSAFSQKWIEQIAELYYDGEIEKSELLINKYIERPGVTAEQKSKLFALSARNHLEKGSVEAYKNDIDLSFINIELPNVGDSAMYFANLAQYYHYQLLYDSSVHYSLYAVELLESDMISFSNAEIARVYHIHGNCMRNAVHYDRSKYYDSSAPEIISRRALSLEILQKALKYANSNQRHYIYRTIGTVYNDLMSCFWYDQYSGVKYLKEKNELLAKGLENYALSIRLAKKEMKKPERFVARSLALTGLSYQYVTKYELAEINYNKSLEYSSLNGEVHFLNEFNIANSWMGWNYEEWYKEDQSFSKLKLALNTYENSVKSWMKFYRKQKSSTEGFEDSYRISTIHKIPSVCYLLYEETNDIQYVNKALYYSDLDQYLTYTSNNEVTVEKLQRKITANEVLLVYANSVYPSKVMVVIIEKDDVDFKLISEKRMKLDQDHYASLNGFNGLQGFKEVSARFYNRLFRPLDSMLSKKQVKNVIVIPSAGISQLNFDLLISDTLSDTWKKQPYMFHKYNFSYALAPRIFLDNYRNTKSNKASFGFVSGDFSERTNLLFSDQMTNWIESELNAKMLGAENLQVFKNEINSKDVILAIGHGQGDYRSSNSIIAINDQVEIHSDEIYKMELDNELFVTTACNTNLSKSYFSEGLTGGFAKALHYSGVKSTITTLWEIDDKTNAFIMQSFFKKLNEGKSKSEALWASKKEYWNKAEQDEEFKPYYWSAYRLYGNTSSLSFKEREISNWWWCLLLILPITFVLIYRFRENS